MARPLVCGGCGGKDLDFSQSNSLPFGDGEVDVVASCEVCGAENHWPFSTYREEGITDEE